jgi:hypothetical protein
MAEFSAESVLMPLVSWISVESAWDVYDGTRDEFQANERLAQDDQAEAKQV